MNLFERIGVFGAIIIIGFMILLIALVKAIFDIRNATQHTDKVISKIAQKQYGIKVEDDNSNSGIDDYQLLR